MNFPRSVQTYHHQMMNMTRRSNPMRISNQSPSRRRRVLDATVRVWGGEAGVSARPQKPTDERHTHTEANRCIRNAAATHAAMTWDGCIQRMHGFVYALVQFVDACTCMHINVPIRACVQQHVHRMRACTCTCTLRTQHAFLTSTRFQSSGSHLCGDRVCRRCACVCVLQQLPIRIQQIMTACVVCCIMCML